MKLPRAIALVLIAYVAAAAVAAPTTKVEPRETAAERRDASGGDGAELVGSPAATVYRDRDGLPQNSVQSIAVDARHYYWAATQDGAACFNGTRWSIVNMPNRRISNYVNAVCAAPDGSVWFGTNQAGCARLRDGVWTTFGTSAASPDDTVNALGLERGESGATRIWVGTAKGLAYVENDRWTAVDGLGDGDDAYVLALAVEPRAGAAAAIWAGTRSGVVRVADGRVTRWTVADGIPNQLVHAMYVGPAIDGRRSVWAGTEGGLVRFVDGAPSVVQTPFAPVDAVVRCIFESVGPDGVDELWIGTIHSGIARFSRGQWALFASQPGKPSNEVITLFQSDEDVAQRAIWVGFNGAGAARLDYGRWLTFDERSGIPNGRVLSFADTVDEDGGRSMWFGTRAGLARLKDAKWSIVDATRGLEGHGFRCILPTVAADGTRVMWVATTSGLARVAGGRATMITKADGLPGAEALDICESYEPGGRRALWVSTESGIARLVDGRVSETYDDTTGLPHKRAQCVREQRTPDGRRVLWVATDKGVARLENGVWRVYGTANGLANDVALSLEIVERDGRQYLWVGTLGGGASRLDLTSGAESFESFSDTTTPALPNNYVYKICEGAGGDLYLSTNRGVARFRPRSPTADDPSDYSVYTFTTADGLPSNEADIGAEAVDGLGRVWVGTSEGVAMLDPSRLPEDATTKPLVLERVTVDDRQIDVSSGLTLEHDANDIVFEFALLSFFRGTSSTYRTQLVGLNDTPSAWSTDPKRVYTTLPSGDFTLLVWGRDYASNVTPPLRVPIRVHPAPWQTWWAYLLYLLAVLGLAWALWRARTAALRRRNAQLEGGIRERTTELAEKVDLLRASEQRAQEASRAKSTFLANMSHELRTPLNAILGFVQLMERERERTRTDREHLSIIGRSGEHLLALINDVLSLSKIEAGQFSLNERPFDLPALLRNIDEMFRLRAQAKGLQLLVELDEKIPRYVEGDDGKLRQILINLLGNAFKFTDAGGVALRVRWDEGVGVFEVEDTGQGIAADELGKLFEAFVQTQSGRASNEGTGLGLAISRNYIHLMGGDITVASELERGTRFTFTIPFAVAEAPAAAQEELRVVGLATNQPAFRVLVVDDKWENRRLLATLLSDVGFPVQEAANGREALESWASWRPDVVWMDIHMPDLDGYEATRRIRAAEATEPNPSGRPTAIFAVTASVFAHDRTAILAAGCNDYVSKPFRNATIFEKMAEHLGVRFVYSRASFDEPLVGSGEPLAGPERFAALPAALVAELNDAVVQGDIESALRVSDAIAEIDEQLGHELRHLVRSYRFDDILDRMAKA